MTFLSLSFIVFLGFTIVLYALLDNSSLRQQWLLLGANYFFYSFFGLWNLVVLMIVSIFTFFAGEGIKKSHSKKLLVISCGCLVALILGTRHFISTPVGVSFYGLLAISYLADIYMGHLSTAFNLPQVLLYISFFPCIISGPITKARDFLPQITKSHKINSTRLSIFIQRFIIGAFEKLVIADRLGLAVDVVYAAPMAYSGLSLFFTSIAYSLQLLFDFAGYSNMAIGIAYLFGFDLGENFNLPYISMNPMDFWRRWHISLSRFFREYVYIPLGGSKYGMLRTGINLILTMIISGLWHGSTLSFILWGLMHGIMLVIHRLLSDKKKEERNKHRIKDFGKMALCFLYVNTLWILFRVKDIKVFYSIICRIMLFSHGIQYYYVYTFVFVVLLIIIEFCSMIRNEEFRPFFPLKLSGFRGKLVLSFIVLLTLMFAYFGNAAFIYGMF